MDAWRKGFYRTTVTTTSATYTLEPSLMAATRTLCSIELTDFVEEVKHPSGPPAPRGPPGWRLSVVQRRHPLTNVRFGFQQMARLPCYRGRRTR